MTVIAGSATGLSIVPIKWARHWRWENFWLLYTVVSLLIVPLTVASVTCPNLWAAYASLPLQAFAKPLVFGGLWGLAYLGAGLCTHRLGFALQGAVIGGVGTAVWHLNSFAPAARPYGFSAEWHIDSCRHRSRP